MKHRIKIEDFNYSLPEERIAKYPLERRDDSKLLVYREGQIDEKRFICLPELLPTNSLIVFNSTKVVPARLIFRKSTGARIEVFCLEPHSPAEYNLSFASERCCEWIATVGNAKRWKRGEDICFEDRGIGAVKGLNLRASIVAHREEDYIIQFVWDGGVPFSRVLELCGNIPIPPYLKRNTEEIDQNRYQTLYAKERGSVAAPTAGLHFSETVFEQLRAKGIGCEELILHVGAGTFRPVKTQYIEEHKMHSEPFTVSRKFLEILLENIENKRNVVAVGTTSTRVLESLYYIGLQIERCGKPERVGQWEPYSDTVNKTAKYSINKIIEWMNICRIDSFNGTTEVMLIPGYEYKIVDILITNFHQPQSTLLLLISAFIGEKWRDIYKYAMDNEFRFLSYGDSSILFGCREKMDNLSDPIR